MPLVPVVALHERRVNDGNAPDLEPLQIGGHPVELPLEIRFDGVFAGRPDFRDFTGIIPPASARIREEAVNADDHAPVPELLDAFIPGRIAERVIHEVVGNATVSRQSARVLLHLVDPVAGVVHIRIFVVNPGGHLAKQIGSLSPLLQIRQHFLLGLHGTADDRGHVRYRALRSATGFRHRVRGGHVGGHSAGVGEGRANAGCGQELQQLAPRESGFHNDSRALLLCGQHLTGLNGRHWFLGHAGTLPDQGGQIKVPSGRTVAQAVLGAVR